MARLKQQKKRRKWVQTSVMLLTNAYIPGFFRGEIYQGRLKQICVPGLNCYSCPGALGACPMGVLQNSIADPYQQISFYVLGFLIMVGAVMGRFVCAWLCPFGLIQEWLHKIPVRKWKPERRPALHRNLTRMKFVILAVFVILLPWLGRMLNGYGAPAFCKYICPSGTLMAGWPLVAVNDSLRTLAGWLFSWKSLVLIVLLYLSTRIMRPFCRYLCPLGALYGLFNRISLYRVTVDWDLCTHCGACTRQCPMAVQVPEDGNTAECIRCGECQAVCPVDAIHCGFKPASRQKEGPLA